MVGAARALSISDNGICRERVYWATRRVRRLSYFIASATPGTSLPWYTMGLEATFNRSSRVPWLYYRLFCSNSLVACTACFARHNCTVFYRTLKTTPTLAIIARIQSNPSQ